MTESVTLNAKVTIKPCTTIQMTSGASIYVADNGSLRSIGEEDCPVVFRSAKAVPSKGDWGQIALYKESLEDNAFHYTHFLHADGSRFEDGALFLDDGGRTTVDVKNVRFEQIGGNAVFLGQANLKSFTDVHMQDVDGTAIIMGQTEVEKLENTTAEDVAHAWIEILDLNTKVTSDVTWKKLPIPYYVKGLTIEAKLEIAAGVQLLMDAESSIAIQAGGSLHTAGVAADPVVIESFKDAPAPGDWHGVLVYATSSNDSELNHTVIRHGGFSVDAGAMFVEVDAQITLNSVVFEDNKDCDIERRGDVVASDTTFVDCPTP